VNSRALMVSFEDQWYFPTYSDFHPGTDFGLDYGYETNYRDLQQVFKDANKGDFVIMPLVPFNAYENNSSTGITNRKRPQQNSNIILAQIPPVGTYWPGYFTAPA